MNLDDLPQKHRANAERQLREQRSVKATVASAYDMLKAKPTPKPGPAPANGFNQAVLTAWLKDHGIPAPRYEFMFSQTRKWRFDICWPAPHKLAVEVQGGLFSGGAHVRGAALLREHDKLNEAASLGWRILYRTPSNLMTAATVELINRSIA